MSRGSFSNDPPQRPQSKEGLRSRTYRSVSVTDTNTRVSGSGQSLANMSSMVLKLTNRRGTDFSLPKNPNSFRRSSGDYVPLTRLLEYRRQRLASIGAVLSLKKRLSLRDYPNPLVDAKRRWRKLKLWVRIQGTLDRLHRYVISKVMNDPSNPFYMLLNQSEDRPGQLDQTRNYVFDASYFKANRQMRTALEVKRVLSLPSEQRTDEELSYAVIGLRGVSAIAEYPVRLQQNLAKYGTFECYDGKRIIVRQGREPEAFYFVLYGRAVVAVKDDVTGRVEIKCCLQRGHFFGELSIINNDCRQSSVITKSYTELLRLSSSVFQQHFMVGGVKNLNDPDHHKFLRSLPFLNGWPIELILDNADHKSVAFGYFKRGSVLVIDSNYSDWLIIIKSGSVAVMKKLTKVTSATSWTNTGWLKTSAKQSSSCVTGSQSCGAGGTICTNTYKKSAKDITPLRQRTSGKEITPLRQHTSRIGQRSSELGPSVNRTEQRDPAMTRRGGGDVEPAFGHTRFQRDRSSSFDLDADEFLGEKKTFLDFLNLTYNLQPKTTSEADLNPQFVFVQTLTKGGVFGLAQCLFTDQPSLCVVSSGADCLLVNKKLFLSNCPPQLLGRLKIEVSPFPSDEKLQEDLVTRVNWEGYKQAVIRELFDTSKTRRK